MDRRTEEILKAFPGLRYDEGFHITSPENPDYNCIAWAFERKDCWMWPDEEIDGVSPWPLNAMGNTQVQTFIDAFKTVGYELCDNDVYEEGKEKIALYAIPDSQECTHAARQTDNGTWTSKLGTSFDISHSTPYTLQGRLYGMVCCILYRRK